MPSFFDLVQGMDAVVESTFGELSVTFHPKAGGDDFTLRATQEARQFQDDYVPGSADGVGVLILFVASGTYNTLVVKPVMGDTATVNAIDYDMHERPIDRMGGVTLRLRKRNRAWNA